MRVDKPIDGIDLLVAADVCSIARVDAPWSCHNLAAGDVSDEGGGPVASFRRVNPARPGNLIQHCATSTLACLGRLVACAEMRAQGAGAAGLNIYLHAHSEGGTPVKVFQIAHPGDGAWHTLQKVIPIGGLCLDHVRFMAVLRSGDDPLELRSVSLQYVADGDTTFADLAALDITPAFHDAVLEVIARHPSGGDSAFRDKLYRSLTGGNRKGVRLVQDLVERLRPAGYTLEGGRFLDLGCGTGGALVGARRSGAAWCEGWEINAEKLALARINLGTLFEVDTGFTIRDQSVEHPASPGPDFQPFHLVFCQEVLEHVKDLDATLETLARCIEPERGVAYVTIPNGFALESVLRDPHLELFGITLLDRFEAQPIARALKNHTHYSAMMGAYYGYGEYARRFAKHGLVCLPLHVAEASPDALAACAGLLREVRQRRTTLRADWGGAVDIATLALVEQRLDAYLEEAGARLEQALAPEADEHCRWAFAQDFAAPHFEFLVAHRESMLSYER
jgi:2-polyprenyl-3-methyl-5-hydroxy-6-metoxy-1,4-benzoquinol methylase